MAFSFDPGKTDEYAKSLNDALPEEVQVFEAMVACVSLMLKVAQAANLSARQALGVFAGGLVGFYGEDGVEAIKMSAPLSDRIHDLAEKTGIVFPVPPDQGAN